MTEPDSPSPSSHEFRLPDLGEGLTEAELLSWSVSVGDTVVLNQVIAEVETAKAVVELPSPFAGTVLALLAEPGDAVPVGAPLLRIGDADSPVPTETEAPHRDSVLVGYGPEAPAASRRRRRTNRVPTPAIADGARSGDAGDAGRPDAKPAARRLAHELGIDLAAVPGTGSGGAVTVDDVRSAANRPAASSAPAPAGRESRVPIHGVRKETAAAMVHSAFTAPHVSVFVTAEVSASMDLVDRLRSTPAFVDLSLTPLALVAKAMLVSLRSHPELNASWDEVRQEIVTKHYVNLGIATATERGLLVPTIADAHTMSLVDLTRAIGVATATARAGTATPADLTGGTITITNVGVFGVDAGTPILPPGQAAILCLGAIARRPWVVGDAVVPRWVTTLGLSFDHRIVDGEQGSRFLADVAAALTDPLALLARA
ncbi:dihydrolipoamide acetyltransferase family protein [Rhodococcus olei]|uniref:Dihydrolipoamide acetyltransferase component of pyruvate dehydrogenase complex n=1 Tax=Rhodococcus olei TaxID=2161675 RepID=A0ABP8P1U4_9NOCA